MLTQDLIALIENFCSERVKMEFDQRRVSPRSFSTDYQQFERDHMSRYNNEEYVTHVTIRRLIEWIASREAVINDIGEYLSAIKLISPNEAGSEFIIPAIVQPLILTGENVIPTINTNLTLLPHEVGFDITSNLIEGQMAWNKTDDVWYVRTNDIIKTFSSAIKIQISNIENLSQALTDIINSIPDPLTFSEPLDKSITDIVTLQYDDTQFEVVGGKLTLKAGVGNLIATIHAYSFDSSNLDGTYLKINHGKKTLNVELLFRDANGNDVEVPYQVKDLDNVWADFGSPDNVPGTWTYYIKYWTGEHEDVYPDPTYALAEHPHNNYSLTTHKHDDLYAALIHPHSEYALVNHPHDGYALKVHPHNYETPLIRDLLTPSYTNKNANIRVDHISARRFGNVVMVSFEIFSSATFPSSGAGGTICKLPVTLNESVRFPMSMYAINNTRTGWGFVTTGGDVMVYLGAAGQSWIANFPLYII